MLRRTSAGWRLEGEREVLIRPAPTPTDDVFEQVHASGGRVAALTKRGLVGNGSMLIATLGPLALEADEPVHVIVLTHSGAFIRQTNVLRDEPPLELDGLRAAAATLGDDAPTVVTASASVQVDAVANALALLQKRTRNISLGVVLPKGTRAPTSESQNNGAHRCAVPKSTTGSLSVKRLKPALRALREEAAQCYESLPAHAQLTWRAPLRLTVAANGSVSDACFVEPSLPQLFEDCLVARAKTIAFPKPKPRGRVTLQIPLRFVPKNRATRAVTPVCL